jgi:hypothetical protein
VCALSDGIRVVSGSNDRTLMVWNVFTGVCEHVLRGHDEVDYLFSICLTFIDRGLPLFVPCLMDFEWFPVHYDLHLSCGTCLLASVKES